jgi:hypothetical protein
MRLFLTSSIFQVFPRKSEPVAKQGRKVMGLLMQIAKLPEVFFGSFICSI